MRDKTHIEQVERWAHYVKEHPNKWKKIHTEFINNIYKKSQEIIEKLLKQKNGKEKIMKIYKIRNIKEYKKFV